MEEATRYAVDIMVYTNLVPRLIVRIMFAKHNDIIFCIYLMIKNINDILRHMVLKMTNYLFTSHRNTKSHTYK